MLLVGFLMVVLTYLCVSRITLKKIRSNPRTKKWQSILSTVLIFAVPAYVILFTVVGSILFPFVLAFVVDPLVPEEHKEEMCDISNSIVATFQPLISDQEMLQYFEKNRLAMQKLADMVHEKRHRGRDGRASKEFEDLQKSLDVRAVEGNRWSSLPYSVEEAQKYEACMKLIDYDDKGKSDTQMKNEINIRFHRIQKCSEKYFDVVSIEPNFGRSLQVFYCTKNRATRKIFDFFPEAAPRIENGRLLWPVDTIGNPNRSTLVVPSTDRINKKEDTYRQIDAHWFISLY
jgi:hypothetical protein